jgi:DNA-binding CsgD family transcriptional regulator
VTPDPDRGEHPWRLTTREREVLEWLATGKTNRDIADNIGAKRRTVEKHLEHIYEKLGVETRTAAVMRAYRV